MPSWAYSTGTYSYLCDGTSPGSSVLYDGHAVYTAGESETRNGVSAYYANDRLGNLWTLDGTTKNQLTYEDFTGFGSVTAGANGQTPFGYGGGNGCLTDADTGLVLMGHRYYDTRIGRFITQDPAGDGDNWYEYTDNSPTNDTDPTGLSESTFSYDSSMSGQLYPGGADDWQAYRDGDYGTYNEYGPNGSGDGKLYYCGTLTVGPSVLDVMMQGGMGLNMGSPGMALGGGRMFAQSSVTTPQGAAEVAQLGEETTGTLGTPKNPFPTFEQARNKALEWLEKRGYQAAKKSLRKFPKSKAGQPNGMTSANGRIGFRVEYDNTNGAHINVFNGKEASPPHFSFRGTEELVEQIIKRYL